MELVFRDFSANADARPGELHLIPPGDARAAALALLVLERGLSPFRRGPGPVEKIVLPVDPSFDALLAATFVLRLGSGQKLPEGCAAFARYAELGRQGRQPSTLAFEDSLEGHFLALRLAGGDQLTEPGPARRFTLLWTHLAERILQAAEADLDPFTTPLFSQDPATAPLRTLLERDRQLYRRDVQGGERWLVTIPQGPAAAAGLLLRRPRSQLFQGWGFADTHSPTGKPYALLVVQDKGNQWLCCANHNLSFSLEPLAEQLQQAEKAQGNVNPWRADDVAGGTFLAAPRKGSCLAEGQVLDLVKQWAAVRVCPGQGRRPWLLGGLAAAALAALLALAAWLVPGLLPEQPPAELPAKETPRDVQFDTDKSRPLVPAVRPRGNLFVVAIGVSRYKHAKYNLAFAHADAQSVVQALERQEGKVFAKVNPTLLTDEKATRRSILEALDQLRGQVTQYDFVLVTLSGHGANLEDDNHFYFLPHNFNGKATAGVYWDDFKRYLGNLPCRVFLVMDTCHSGTITLGFRGPGDSRAELKRQIQSMLPKSEQGMIVMAACLSGGKALELPELGHGVLTLALLEGLGGKYLYPPKTRTALPQVNAAGEITIKDLDFYVSKRVQELAGSQQAVVTNHSGNLALDRIPIAWIDRKNAP